ncbi:MAG: ATP-binding protein, partial [Desulfobulbales bacterium]
MITLRKIIEIDDELCTGCGECIPDCAEGSLEIVDGKARLVADKLCDGLGACLKSCPTGALSIIEREADEFDEDAVQAFLETKKINASAPPGGCPAAQLQSFQPTSCDAANTPALQTASALSHWPVQIRLIPAAAQFLENSDLLVAADCTA